MHVPSHNTSPIALLVSLIKSFISQSKSDWNCTWFDCWDLRRMDTYYFYLSSEAILTIVFLHVSGWKYMFKCVCVAVGMHAAMSVYGCLRVWRCECENVWVCERQTNVCMSMVSMRVCEHVCGHCEYVSIWVCDCGGVLWKTASVSMNVWVCLHMLV